MTRKPERTCLVLGHFSRSAAPRSGQGGRAGKKGPKRRKADANLNTLGVAQYYMGAWDEAIAALSRSGLQLSSGGSPADWFFLAMAHWQKGTRTRPVQWYDKAVHVDGEEQIAGRGTASLSRRGRSPAGHDRPTEVNRLRRRKTPRNDSKP